MEKVIHIQTYAHYNVGNILGNLAGEEKRYIVTSARHISSGVHYYTLQPLSKWWLIRIIQLLFIFIKLKTKK